MRCPRARHPSLFSFFFFSPLPLASFLFLVPRCPAPRTSHPTFPVSIVPLLSPLHAPRRASHHPRRALPSSSPLPYGAPHLFPHPSRPSPLPRQRKGTTRLNQRKNKTKQNKTSNPLRFVAAFEAVCSSFYDGPSLGIKMGVQYALFGGAIRNLGTSRHAHLIARADEMSLLGCFALTEFGHGSNARGIGTTATYDPASDELVVHTPRRESRKRWIGGAATYAELAVVFARLVVSGKDEGVHAVLVPIRDGPRGRPMRGVTLSDCGPKEGLNGIDNGIISFDRVRVPRTNLLNRFGDIVLNARVHDNDNSTSSITSSSTSTSSSSTSSTSSRARVDADGGARSGNARGMGASGSARYVSPIPTEGKRFSATIGELVTGRVLLACGCALGSRTLHSFALMHSLRRRQFGPTESPRPSPPPRDHQPFRSPAPAGRPPGAAAPGHPASGGPQAAGDPTLSPECLSGGGVRSKDQGSPGGGHGTETVNRSARAHGGDASAYGVGQSEHGAREKQGDWRDEDGHTGGSGERDGEGREDSWGEVPLLFYATHRRRILPHLAADLAHAACCDGLKRSFERARVKFLGAETDDPVGYRDAMEDVETDASSLKAVLSWHLNDSVQRVRECLGGDGYARENIVGHLRPDVDVYTTFEGDNTVLMQQACQRLLKRRARQMMVITDEGKPRGLSLGSVGMFIGGRISRAWEENACNNYIVRSDCARWHLRDPSFLVSALRYRAEVLVDELGEDIASKYSELSRSASQREGSPDDAKARIGSGMFACWARNSRRAVETARAHVEHRVRQRAVREGMGAASPVRPSCRAAEPHPETSRVRPPMVYDFDDAPGPRMDNDEKVLAAKCASLYALSRIEADSLFFLRRGYITTAKAVAISREVERLCHELAVDVIRLLSMLSGICRWPRGTPPYPSS